MRTPRRLFEIFFDGRLHMTFLETGWRGLTGLSEGTGVPSLFPTSNFLATPHCRAPTGGEVPIAGKQLTLRTKGTPQVTKFQTVLGTIDPVLIPPQGGATDPTIHGGSIELYNPRTGEFLALPLPAVAWTAVQSTKGLTYKYRDNAGVHGPCSSVEVSARGVRAKCDRGSLAFTLDEVQFKLATSVTLGATSTGTRFCGLFGGKITRDYGYAFSAKKAPVANRCWLPDSYYP